MTELFSALNSHAGVLLLVLCVGLLALAGVIAYHASGMRWQQRANSNHLAEQLTRVLAALQKINSNLLAQSNQTKEQLNELGPALKEAGEFARAGAEFTAEFKAVRGEVRRIDERVEALQRITAELSSSQSAAAGALNELGTTFQALQQLQSTNAAARQSAIEGTRELGSKLDALRQDVASVRIAPPVETPPPGLRQLDERVGSLQQALTAAAQAQATSAREFRADLSALAAGQARAVQMARDSLATELREQEARFRQLTEKFLAESAQLRARIEAESQTAATRRETSPSSEPLDAEARKEFRKLGDRLDGLQRRMEEIIRL